MPFRSRFSFLLAAAASTALVHAQTAPAQQRPPAPQMIGAATPDADRLAADMRLLADNPQNLTALIDGAELTLKLGDPTAAAALYGRATKIDPNNPRIKAGLGSLLVQAERPGEALRRFAEAQALGYDPRRFAADRGLAYDLIGEQERAQRDYRLALKTGPDETVTLRYALSLGISGDADRGLTLIDPLVHANDRAAWRTRAFLMAMKGDAVGAENIAKVMMPGGQGQGLEGFFQRLPNLSPIDRAFAVHFGETRATPERLADARLAPPLAALGPDPDAVQLAASTARAAQPAAGAPARQDRKSKKHGHGETQVAALAPAARPLPQPGFTAGQAPAPAPVTPQPVAPATQPPVQLASRAAPPPETSTRVAAPPVRTNPVPPVTQAAPYTATPAPQPAYASSGSALPAAPVPVQPSVDRASVVTPPPKPVTLASAADTPPPVVRAEPAHVTPAPARPTPARIGGEDSILARIVANIAVPGSELGVQGAPERAAVPVPAPAPTPAPNVRKEEPAHVAPSVRPVEAKKEAPSHESASAKSADHAKTPLADAAKPVRKGAKAKVDEDEDASDKSTDTARPGRETAKGKSSDDLDAAEAKAIAASKSGRKGAKGRADDSQDASDEKPVDSKAAARKAAEDKKAAAAKKAAAEKAAADKKAKDEQRAEEKANPARVWVQVAGGASENDLPKAWKAAKGKAPNALGGRSGWTTPLRATNRVLAGPFKTTEEAQSFVNQLRKEGISGFVFESDKGQKITKLPAK